MYSTWGPLTWALALGCPPYSVSFSSMYRFTDCYYSQKKASSQSLILTWDTGNRDRGKRSGQTHLFLVCANIYKETRTFWVCAYTYKEAWTFWFAYTYIYKEAQTSTRRREPFWFALTFHRMRANIYLPSQPTYAAQTVICIITCLHHDYVPYNN